MTKKTATKATSTRKTAAKRELIDTGSDKRFVRRGAAGAFKESDDVGKSLSQDSRKKAKNKAKRGQGDKGDR
jgi:bifunctional non-homologous end joining protein LigD